MKGLKKFRQDNNASVWYLSRLTGLPEDAYLRFENMKDDNIPSGVKSELDKVMQKKEEISKYYENAESFYINNDLNKIFSDANIDYDTISFNTYIGLDIIKSVLEDGQPFPDNNVRDKLIDYAMWINETELQNKNEVKEPSEECLQSSVLPSPDDETNIERISKDQILEDLKDLVSRDKQIFSCIAHLVEIIHKNIG